MSKIAVAKKYLLILHDTNMEFVLGGVSLLYAYASRRGRGTVRYLSYSERPISKLVVQESTLPCDEGTSPTQAKREYFASL